MRDFSLGLALLDSRPKGVSFFPSPTTFCFVFKGLQFQESKLLACILFWLVQQADVGLASLGRGKGEGRGIIMDELGTDVLDSPKQSLWIFFSSVTSCEGSIERSPQDTDPDVPSSTSAVTTETGSDEVFIISAGPGASGLSFTTYRIQVGMLLGISRSPASHRMSFLKSICHVPSLNSSCLACRNGSDLTRQYSWPSDWAALNLCGLWSLKSQNLPSLDRIKFRSLHWIL